MSAHPIIDQLDALRWATAALSGIGVTVLSVYANGTDAPRIHVRDPGALLDAIDAEGDINTEPGRFFQRGVHWHGCRITWLIDRGRAAPPGVPASWNGVDLP